MLAISNKEFKNKLCLGTWAFGGDYWGCQEDENSIEVMEVALDCGVTHWDTALAYGDGRSEKLCGQFMKDNRSKIFLATKGGIGKKPQSIIQNLQRSLKNLRTDYIDLYYIHWPKKNLDMRPHMELLEKEREKGTIKNIGVSNFNIKQMQQLGEVGKIDVTQICYNLFWRIAENEIIPYCHKYNISVVAYSAIAQGILTGKFLRDHQFEKDDKRGRTIFFDEEFWPHLIDASEKLNDIANQIGCSLLQLTIQWLVYQKNITSFIVGARNGKQIKEIHEACFGKLILEDTILKITDISNNVCQHYPKEENIFKWYP